MGRNYVWRLWTSQLRIQKGDSAIFQNGIHFTRVSRQSLSCVTHIIDTVTQAPRWPLYTHKTLTFYGIGRVLLAVDSVISSKDTDIPEE